MISNDRPSPNGGKGPESRRPLENKASPVTLENAIQVYRRVG